MRGRVLRREVPGMANQRQVNKPLRTSEIVHLKAPPPTGSAARAAFEANWDKFVRAYGPVIYGYCRKRCLTHHQAEDLVQVVLVKVYRGIATWNPSVPSTESFEAWLFRCMANAVCDHFR